MPSVDPISSVAEGATSAIISKGIEYIKDLVQKFKDRKILFVQDKKPSNL